MNIEHLDKYTNLFERHVLDTQLHISGVLEGGNVDDDEEVSLLVYLPQWTKEENNIFFHALSIHSRLRPDLIAEHLPNKCAADVMLYIELLDQQELLAVTHPFALESSPQFVKNEENHAKLLLQAASKTTISPVYDENTKEDFARILESLDEVAAEAIDKILDTDSVLADYNNMDMGGMDINDEEQSTPSSQGASPSRSQSEELIEPGPRVSPLSRQPSIHSVPDNPEQGASSPTSSVDAQDLSLLSIMTPAERRRYHKKMYMRRKRGVADDRVENFATGRKRQSLDLNAASGNNSEDGNDSPTMDEEQTEEYRAFSELQPPSVTPVDIVLQNLKEMGVTVNSFADIDMDLFYLRNLLTLGRNQRPISATVIRLLNGFVVEYVHELVRHSVISRELEVDIKRSEDWGIYHRNELTKDNVLNAIEIVRKRQSREEPDLGPARGKDCSAAILPKAYSAEESDLIDEDTDDETLEAEFKVEDDMEAEDEAEDAAWDTGPLDG